MTRTKITITEVNEPVYRLEIPQDKAQALSDFLGSFSLSEVRSHMDSQIGTLSSPEDVHAVTNEIYDALFEVL